MTLLVNKLLRRKHNVIKRHKLSVFKSFFCKSESYVKSDIKINILCFT